MCFVCDHDHVVFLFHVLELYAHTSDIHVNHVYTPYGVLFVMDGLMKNLYLVLCTALLTL